LTTNLTAHTRIQGVFYPSYILIPVPAGTVTEANTGTGNTAAWGAGSNSAYAKPYTVSAFSIGETEVTYALWKAVYDWATDNARGADRYTFANPGRQGGNSSTGPVGTSRHPVTEISWRDAVVWCNAYSEMSGKEPVYYTDTTYTTVLRTSTNTAADGAKMKPGANGYRLPTEAQWEYAARGGIPHTGTPWTYTYAGSNTVGNVAVYSGNSGGQTAAVKSKAANSLGLYDMSGNVWEWCQDIYSGSDRVLRGGARSNSASYCTVASRDDAYSDDRGTSIGFRVVAP
jgi:formylglycine-generating enzyme required for sulfatase activity